MAFLFFLLLCCTSALAYAADDVPASYIVYMGNRDESLHPDAVTESHYSLVASVLGSAHAAEKAITHTYKYGFSGFAAYLTPTQAEIVSKHPGVVSVFRSKVSKLVTTRSWDFLGLPITREAPKLYNMGGNENITNLLRKAKYGRGIIIGSLDSGVWPESESFKDHHMPPVPKKWKGICESGFQFNASHCNRKIIGARAYFPTPEFADVKDLLSPRDEAGHGTHTASTAAGALVEGVVEGVHYLNHTYQGTARGGAPMAHLAVYKVCWTQGCGDDGVLHAFDQAIYDGVDIITMSFGGIRSGSYELDAQAIGSFHAVQKGIVVLAAAGNDGPSPSSVCNEAPWMISVGASTIDRSFNYAHVKLGNGQTLKNGFGNNLPLNKMYPLEYDPSSPEAAQCLDSNGVFPKVSPERVKGKIVVCVPLSPDYGSMKQISEAIGAAGGVGMILISIAEYIPDVYRYSVPTVHLTFTNSNHLLDYIRTTRNPVASFIGGPHYFTTAPSVADFSSRGPSRSSPDVLKVDIIAPGVNIIAALSPVSRFSVTPTASYHMLSGTSMACPHVAGVAALLKAAHPDWSPAAVLSAIVTTGFQFDNQGNSLKGNPFNFGGGHINPNAAADPGLVYDAGTEDYKNLTCALGMLGQQVVCPTPLPAVVDFNYPSISALNLTVGKNLTISRRVTSIGRHGSTYKATVEAPVGVVVTVTPDILRFEKTGQTLSFQVTVYVEEFFWDNKFGSLTWHDGKHTVRSPLALGCFGAPQAIL